MQARMNHPAMVVPDAMKALQTLGELTKHGLPEKLLELVHLRASQIKPSTSPAAIFLAAAAILAASADGPGFTAGSSVAFARRAYFVSRGAAAA